MTTIAWDGRTLAADRRCTVSGHCFEVSKLRRTEDGRLLAIAGDLRGGQVWLEWLMKPEGRRQAPPASVKDGPMILEVRPDRRVFRWSEGTCVEVGGTGVHAIGSGRDYACAAMHLGRNALEAVEVAARFDAYTGNGVDTLELEHELCGCGPNEGCPGCPV